MASVLKLKGLKSNVAGNSFTQSTKINKNAVPREFRMSGRYTNPSVAVVDLPRALAAWGREGDTRPKAESAAPVQSEKNLVT